MEASQTARATAILWATIGLSCLPGCASLGKVAQLGGHSDPPAGLARYQQDPAAHASPGSSAAAEAIEESPAVSPETRGHVELALGQMQEEAGDPEAARPHYERALKLDPKSVDASLALARIYAHIGRPDAATKLYDRAVRDHRSNASVHNDRGLHLAEQKDWAGATASLRKAVKLDPSNSRYHNNLGMVLAGSGKYEEAWDEFREAVGPAVAHYNVAAMLARAGRNAEARDHLERALVIMPGLRQAEGLVAELRTGSPKPVTEAAQKPVEVELGLLTADLEDLEDPAEPAGDALSAHADAAPAAGGVAPTAVEPVTRAEAEHRPAAGTGSKDPWSVTRILPRWLR